MSNVLNPLYDNTIDFKAWASYLYSFIKKYKTNDFKTIIAAYDKDIKEEKNTIERNINIIRKEDPINFIYNLSNMLFDIKKILERINLYNSKFEISRVQTSFVFLGIKWKEEQFELINQLGKSVTPYIEDCLKQIIFDSIQNHAFDNDAQLKKRIFENINSPYILYVLKTRHSETIFDEKASDPIIGKTFNTNEHTVYDDLAWQTFKIIKLNQDQEDNLKDAIVDLFTNLKSHNFIDNSCTLTNFRKIFAGKSLSEIGLGRIIWVGTIVELHHFIDCIMPILKNPENERWRVGVNCFITKSGRGFNLRTLGQSKIEQMKKGRKEVLEKITSNYIQLIQ
jgi:hypothetical protein